VIAGSDSQTVEKKTRQNEVAAARVSAKHFSIARSDSPQAAAKNPTGITIQIRMKSAANAPTARLLTRKNTEFWLTAND
jgi:hypothetical protein